ncbi:hypothetical protein GCM10009823_02660 [Brevibacterium salitolerans]|uniref:Uncharacterized protein n=1 Tax=Brevibacterium salitolerans TaxID=1403566 RepID=A0ABN2WBQ4_9MICO
MVPAAATRSDSAVSTVEESHAESAKTAHSARGRNLFMAGDLTLRLEYRMCDRPDGAQSVKRLTAQGSGR